MAEEPGESTGAKQLATWVGIVGGIVSLLVGFKALTGINLLDKLHPSSTSSPTLQSSPSPLCFLYCHGPHFIETGAQFAGTCATGCPMSGTFSNDGSQTGAATATFTVYARDSSGVNGAELASCSAVIPETPKGGVVSAGCTAYSASLTQYFKDNPGGDVGMGVTVQT